MTLQKLTQWSLVLASPFLFAAPSLAQDEAAPSTAEDTSSAEDEDDDTETILITESTRRTTRLLETPISMSVVSEDNLVRRNVTSVLRIEKLVPNLRVQDQRTLGAGAIQFTLRGIGNGDFTEAGDPNVGFHVDGIYLSRPQAASAFLFDLERFEVLRGPQGILFGRNSTVGTVNVVTAKADATKVEGRVEGQLGTFNDRMLRGVLNVPVFDLDNVSLAFRGAAFARHRDSQYNLSADPYLGTITDDDDNPFYPVNPYISRFGRPDDETDGAGAINERGLRVAARLKAFDRLTIDANYEVFENNSSPAPLTVRDEPYSAQLDMPMTMDQETQGVRGAVEYNQPGLFTFKYTTGYTFFHQVSTIDLDAGNSRHRDETLPRFAGQDVRREAQFFYDNPFANDSFSHEVQLSSDWDAPLKGFIGAFMFEEESERNLWIDIPSPEQGVILFQQPSRIARSQAVFGELTWDITDKWELKGGLRYSMDEKVNRNGSRSDIFPGGIGVLQNREDFPNQDGFGCPLASESLGQTPVDARENGACGISLTQQQLGFTDENGETPSFDRVFENKTEYDNLDWAVSLAYKPKTDSVIYAKAATGYKSGGYLDTFYVPRNNNPILTALEQENLIALELGAKSTFFDGSLRVAADIYAMFYDNKQETILVNFGDLFCPYVFGDFDGDGQIDNADILSNVGTPGVFELTQADAEGNITATPEQLAECDTLTFNRDEFNLELVELVNLNVSGAYTAGLEMEWFWQITGGLRFDGFLTLNPFNEVGEVDTSGFDLPPEVLGDVIACQDRVDGCPTVNTLEGNRLPYSPIISGAVNLGYDFFLGDSVLSLESSLNFQSDYFLSIWNLDCYQSNAPGNPEVCDNGDRQEAYATLDLNVRYVSPYDRLYIEGYGTNITDTVFATFNRRQNGDGVTTYAFNPRREVGVRMGVRF